MPALFFLLLFWLLPVLIGLGLGYLLDRRRAHTVGRATRSCCGMVVIQTRDDAPDDAASDAMPAMEWPDALPVDLWSALVLDRLRRLAALTPDAARGFDGAELIRRAAYTTYVDCQQLGVKPDALVVRRGARV